MNQQHKAIFIDKDGTLIPDIPYNVNVDLISIEPETIEGLQTMKAQGFLLVVVSNQSGVALGYFNENDLKNVTDKIKSLLKPYQIYLDGFYYCPHYPDAVVKEYAIDCYCRKPMPGLILRAARDFKINLSQSWMIGDILNDVEAGKRAGCKTVLLDNGHETEWILNPLRTPDLTANNIKEAALLIKEHSKKLLTAHERVEDL
ncbi:MAG: D-glycero-alpha-D-manno-heptose-1,7-bisphosphate 7-phosphatase [Flavisolibacter sp.]